ELSWDPRSRSSEWRILRPISRLSHPDMSVPKSASPRLPRLYLATPLLGDVAEFRNRLLEAIDAADIAAVLLRLGPADERTLINRVKELASAVQERDVAVLIDGHVNLVARAGADGAHIRGSSAAGEALQALKPNRIVGVGGLHSRHDAMVAGESGADYVLFGEPDEIGRRPGLEAILDRLSWWA